MPRKKPQKSSFDRAIEALRRGECRSFLEASRRFKVSEAPLKQTFQEKNYKLAETPGPFIYVKVEEDDDVDEEAEDNYRFRCYLCLCKGESFSALFDGTPEAAELVGRIEKFLHIEVQNSPSNPNQVCSCCVQKLIDFVQFHQMIVENRIRLSKPEEKIAKEESLSPPVPAIASFSDDDYDDGPEVEEDENEESKESPKATNSLEEVPETSPKHSRADAGEHKYADLILSQYFQFHCDRCPKRPLFPRFKALQNHVRSEHGIGQIEIRCVYCQSRFHKRSKLYYHLAKRHLAKVESDHYDCHFCPTSQKIFRTRAEITAHMKRLHATPLQCGECNAPFRTKYLLQRDFKTVHNFVPPAVKRKLCCSRCSCSYATRRGLNAHIARIHEAEPYQTVCDICARIFDNKDKFQRHYESAHMERTVTCPTCGEMFLNERSMMKHFKHIHNRVHVTCEQCGLVSASLHALRQHILRQHCEPKHVCQVCSKPFRCRYRLKEHMSTHGIGGAIYRCPLCSKTFNFSSSWSLHRKTQHPKEWIESQPNWIRAEKMSKHPAFVGSKME